MWNLRVGVVLGLCARNQLTESLCPCIVHVGVGLDAQDNLLNLVALPLSCSGVCWNKKNRRWQAAINSGGKYIYLGSFVQVRYTHLGWQLRYFAPHVFTSLPKAQAFAWKYAS